MKESILWSTITWPAMTKQNIQPEKVCLDTCSYINMFLQRFLDRCHKSPVILPLNQSQTVSIFNLLEQQDKSAFKRAIDNHMLGAIIPKDKELVYNLRRRRCHLPQIKTERYKKTFVNRLIFKYNLV